jgi:hypothetical protein
MTRAALAFAVLELLVLPLWGGRARAQEATAPEVVTTSAREATRFLPGTSTAIVGASAATTAAWGGYDTAAHTAVLSVGTELRIVSRVSIVAGVAYGNAALADVGLRPQVGARVQLLREAASGIDASAAFMFRQDRFTSEDGLFQGTLALGRSFGATSAVLNVTYGQDGEGDDHQGEVRVAGIRRVRGGLHLGVEGRYMHSLASTDPHRAMNGTPSVEALAGPVVAYMVGRWAFVAEAGLSAREVARLETGVTTLGGIGTMF